MQSKAHGAVPDRSQETVATGLAPHYRPDIDGLRALAILPIIMLHCGIDFVRGGFVGVDIFFVISGYLLTGIIWRDMALGRFTIVGFLRHRVVRILPALFAMLAIVLAAGCVILLPNQIRDLGRSAAAASLFVSNVYFYLTADYFDATSDAKPLIHIWSLAVEEQFYLLYPLLLVALGGLSKRRLVTVIGCLAVASFALGGALVGPDPSAAFFLLPSRMWELLLGALTALGAAPKITSARWRGLVCLGALCVIVVSCLVIGIRWTFPVPFALPAAAAAATLLAYGETGPTARLLGARPLRAIGLLSYSLYLWHRPIIAFYQVDRGTTLALKDSAVLIAAAFVAATLSYWLVERPAIRTWRNGRGLWPHYAALGLLASGALGGLLIAARTDQLRPLPPTLARVASYLGHETTAAGRRQFDLDRCFSIPTHAPFDLGCLNLARDRRNVMLFGDSHAAHYSEALRQALPGTHIVQATAAGCLPLIGTSGGLAGCRYARSHAFDDVDFGRVDIVILSARWLAGQDDALRRTIRFLQARKVRVVVVGPSSEYDGDLPMLIVRGALTGQPDLPARFLLQDRVALDRAMAPFVRATGATYFSAIGFECPAGRCRLLARDGEPDLFDHSHKTPGGARDLVASLAATHALDPRATR